MTNVKNETYEYAFVGLLRKFQSKICFDQFGNSCISVLEYSFKFSFYVFVTIWTKEPRPIWYRSQIGEVNYSHII